MDVFACADVTVQNDQGQVDITWGDGHISHLPIRRLRGYCPCAECQGHGGTIAWIENRASRIGRADLMGRYAINFHFDDGHHTGIFRFEYLRKLDPAEANRWGAPEEALDRHPQGS